MRHKFKRKNIRKKYKRLVAAVAGVAVMSTAMLHGTSLPKVQASSGSSINPVNTVIHTTVTKSDWLSSPVSLVKANAYKYGFNPDNDRFSLLSKTGNKATVQVKTGGQTFKVDLTRSGLSDWKITTIRGIGNMKYPASYIPASFFELRPGVTLAAAEAPAPSVLLYQNNNFANWTWYESKYPDDLNFGVLVQDPRLRNGRTPAEIYDQVKNIDFKNQLVLYAYLGSVRATGYGIGIERVAASDDRITVTVRTKSPRPDEQAAAASKPYDIVTLDRTALNFWSPLHVSFIDQNNTVLSNYTIIMR